MSGFKTPDGRSLFDTFLTNEEFMSRCVGTKLLALGYNQDGRLGINQPTNCTRFLPTQVGTNLNWATICAGERLSHAIKTDGTLWGWGYNFRGNLGNNNRVFQSSPVQTVAGGTNWARISTSNAQNTTALKCDGTMWVWGGNWFGQLGDGTTIYARSSPVQIANGGTDWCRISSCRQMALKDDGYIWRWLRRYDYDTCTFTCFSSPTQQTDLGNDWKEIYAAGSYFGIKNDRTLWGWGGNYYGTLGDNTTISRNSPVQISPDGKAWRQVSTQKDTVAAIKVDGSLWTWGQNCYDQLNVGDCVHRSSPVQTVAGGTNWKCVSTSNSYRIGYSPGPGCPFTYYYHGYSTAAINTSNELFVWGKQLGNANAICNITRDTVLVWGSTPHVCVTGFSSNNSTPSPLLKASQPSNVHNNWNIVATHGINGGSCTVFGNTYFYCPQHVGMAVRNDGTLWAWGCNKWGQLGNLTTADSFSSLVRVCSSCTDWCFISGYMEMSGGITTNGRLWTWGRGHCGMLGTGNTSNRSSPGETIAGGTNWRQFAANRKSVAAIKTDGTLWTWGLNACGPLGTGNTTNRSSPGQTAVGGTTWVCVSSTFQAFQAVRSDGSIWAWGDNRCGQLGATPCACRLTPAAISFAVAGCGWVAVSGSTVSVSALKNDGTIWTWGCLGPRPGNGTNLACCSGSPVQAFGNDWCSISSTHVATIAQKTDGSLWAWGYTPQNGNSAAQCSPVQLSASGTAWKSFLASTSGGASVAIRCCFPLSYTAYENAPLLSKFTYTNIKSASVGAKHLMLTRFIGDDL